VLYIALSINSQNGLSYQCLKDEIRLIMLQISYTATQSGGQCYNHTANGCTSNSLLVLLQTGSLSTRINTSASSICPNEPVTIETALTGNLKIQWKVDDKRFVGE
jgi:hypothetical protein